jgi:PAS domain S-box-containing protein
MRQVDWSKTALGPVDSWPMNLKTCLRIVLTSRQPMFLWWGPELLNLYNDAYKSILGGKHPQALGQPASVVWREIWEQISPRANAAMRGNEGTYDEALLLIMERNGYPEETYYTFSYSPVPNDDGSIGGIICANTEDTRRIVGERQLALLREQAARGSHGHTFEEACVETASAFASNRKDIPFALLYLVEADGSRLSLAATLGVEPGSRAAPRRIARDEAGPWPLRDVLENRSFRLVDLDASFGALPSGAWPRPPSKALLAPIAAAGEVGLSAVLIVGLNPFRLFDESYEGFLALVAGQFAASLANAQAAQEERKRLEALAEIDRAKTTFFSNVSHEFRTPLTLMLGPIEDMRTSSARDADDQERLDLIHRNAQRLLKLVNTLLDFSRIEAGRVEAVYEPTDLAASTADLASTFRSAIEGAGLAYHVETRPLAEPVYVDSGMWEKIVLNLLSNAFKFTLEGSIAVSLRQAEGFAELEVRDTGVGIPEEELPRVFERFHRIERARSRSHEGSGIGLALVHELVRMHGGEIAVRSRDGVGTAFTVRLPLGTQHLPVERIREERSLQATATSASAYVEEALRWVGVTASAGPSDSLVARPSASTPARARVVVADDNADMREYVAKLLREHWDVEAVPDGVAALDAIRSAPPDLVVCDVMMPGTDGFALIRALRHDASLRDIPVILLSARAGEEAISEGLTAGADDYLVKPFTARELLVRVAARLAAASQARSLREQRLNLYRTFLQAPFPIAILRGKDHVVETINNAALEIWGRGPEIVGLPLLVALPEVRDQPFPALLDQVYRSAAPHVGRDELVRVARGPGGPVEDRFFTYVFAPIFDAAGRPEGVMASSFDVTEQVRSREALERTTARLEAARSSAGIAIFEWELGHSERGYWSPEVWPLLGLQADSLEAAPNDWLELVADEDRPRAREAFAAAVAARETRLEVELRLRQRGGGARWVRVSQRIAYDPSGAPARVVGAMVDIQALKEAAEARERERRRLLSLLHQVPAIVNVFRGPDMIFEFAHRKAVEAVGGRELVGRRLRDAIPEFGSEGILDRLRHVYETGETVRLEELPVGIKEDGRERLTYWTSVYVPVRDDAGRVEGVMTFDLDVTAHVAAREALEKAMGENELARVELERANRAKDEFLATMSHELRTPLNSMLGWATMLRRDPRDPAKLSRGLEVIERNARAQERLVSDLLDISRIISGKLQLNVQPTRLLGVIHAAADVVRTAAEGKGVRLVVDVDPAIGETMADPDRLQQVFWNLLVNAVRFTPRGGRVAFSAERIGEALRFAVQDTGEGIPAEHLPFVFDRFRQVDSSTTRKQGGLGLGLAIVRHLVEAHGGYVRAQSDGPDLGSTFTVVLPAVGMSAAGPAESAEGGERRDGEAPAEVAHPAASLRDVSVLLVEDDGDTLELLREVLRSAGARVTGALNAREALEAHGPFDIVISDIAMPDMDGYTFMRLFRSRGADVPALAITAYARKEDAERAWRAGYQEHVAKPVDAANLVEVVRKWTQMRKEGFRATAHQARA